MNRLLIAALAASTVVGGLATSGGSSCRPLTSGELRGVIGGTVSLCSTTGMANGQGWNCMMMGSMACTAECNMCMYQSQANCGGAFFCWECLNAAGTNIKECRNTGGKGCTDFGGPAQCGNEMRAPCAWDPVAQACGCGFFTNNGTPCPRKDCA